MEHNRKTRKISRFLQNFYKQIQYQMGVVTMRTATSGFLQVELNVALVDDANARYDLKELHQRFHPPASK
ncbi:hypothetical protein HYR99_13015 [Candidatus Poribacteria bacterium]|nr:hypothetical protein [Candidatus Poribacteria bacterium]